MSTNLILRLTALSERYNAKLQRRYQLIGELLRLEVLFSDGVPYTLFGFEQVMEILDTYEDDLEEE